MGFGGFEALEIPVEHRVLRNAGAGSSRGGERHPWTSRLELAWPETEDDPAFVAVLVEDLDSGSWGARRIDLAAE